MKRQCTLIISHACNLNCVYCYEKYKSLKQMSLNIAKDIITHEIETLDSSRYDGIDFNFIGGEPLTNFSLIRNICEWSTQFEKIHFNVITNGTLFNNENKLWFENHKSIITVDISVDGINSVQHTNRGCLTSEIPIDWVRKNWPNNRYKMTISKKSISKYADSLIYLEDNGFKTMPSLAVGEEWNEKDAIIYTQQLESIITHFLDKPINYIPSFLLQSIDSLFENHNYIYKSCQTGDSSITYDIDGNSYPCILFSPLVIKSSDNNWKNLDFKDITQFEDPECKNCFIKNMCKTCYGYNYQRTGTLYSKDKRMCKMYQTEIYHIAKFQKALIENTSDSNKLSSIEEQRLQRVNFIINTLQRSIDK